MPTTAQHIVKSYDEELKRLTNAIVEMGGAAESQLDQAIQAVARRDSELAGRVVRNDGAIDQLEEVVQTLLPTAEAKGLWLRVMPPDAQARVRADRRALQQILINLTGNALKFTARGGVSIEVSGTTGVDIAVRDTGVGISEADRARLFQAFTQVGDAGTRKSEGTGLGLHLSTKLAALMGGRIDVDSEPGRGSVFTLRLERG